jgi:ribonuclease E
MTKRMLIDASHAEETRVVVLDGSRLEDYDVETANKKQLKGNIYLAKVVRVEPSLQAAFVEYGGNRHGFLAFSEIHPDYYQIPVADRQRLLEMQEQEAREDEEAEEAAAGTPVETAPAPQVSIQPIGDDSSPASERGASEDGAPTATDSAIPGPATPEGVAEDMAAPDTAAPARDGAETPTAEATAVAPADENPAAEAAPAPQGETSAETGAETGAETWAERAQPALITDEVITGLAVPEAEEAQADAWPEHTAEAAPVAEAAPAIVEGELGADLAPEALEPATSDEGEQSEEEDNAVESVPNDAPPPETLGGGDTEDRSERRPPPRFLRHYKIQEVIRRRQILLVQVVKEERGTKGAALTTYVSLAGRYCVLMPNSPRGGGISRKITSVADRKRLREITNELDIPGGMGLIVRTAGAQRPKPEIKRDCEYLLRLWDDIRDRTMASTAPALIYEEANLIKRTIRDVYSRDIDEVIVDGEEAWRAARDFMRMLMPSHARKVQLWKDGGQPLFARNQVEAQLDSMLSPTVQLRSGGYLVINQTEALVAIDVNSGRSTRERGIEETALRTNLEAADEVARQLRLRDLAGLIVIDFIDMEAKKHNAMVERRLKEALKTDRARIQVGHISHFGLMEMSRQRLRPSLAETSFVLCPHCGGTGHVRSTESAALHVLRGIEEEGSKRRASEILVHVNGAIALYIFNHKRQLLAEIEARYAMHIGFATDDTLLTSQIRIDRVKAQVPDALPPVIRPDAPRPEAPVLPAPAQVAEAEDEEEVEGEETGEDEGESAETAAPPATQETGEESERRRRRRRRRRRGGRREEGPPPDFGLGPQPSVEGPLHGHVASLVPETDAPVLIAETETETETGEKPEPRVAETAAETVPEPMPEAVSGPLSESAPELVPESVPAPPPMHAEAAPELPREISEPVAAAPAPEAGETQPTAEEGRSRRRGQRGGRRRKRDEEVPAEPAPAPYSGPTPADPFGGQVFDIFDAIEQATAEAPALLQPEPAQARAQSEIPEPAVAAQPERTPEALASELTTEPASLPEPTPEPEPHVDPAPEPVVPEAAAPEPTVEPTPTPEPIAADIPEPIVPLAAAPEHVPEPEPEPEAGPAIKPILIGSGDVASEKKRGWWRR